jgi:hypothetical protein
MLSIDAMYEAAIAAQDVSSSHRDVDVRQRKVFLEACLKWSQNCGSVLYGDLELHDACAVACEAMRLVIVKNSLGSPNSSSSRKKIVHGKQIDESEEKEGQLIETIVWHLALAENPVAIHELMRMIRKEGGGELQDVVHIMTLAVLIFLAVENLRDANILVDLFKATNDDTALVTNILTNAKPNLITFNIMLLQLCERDAGVANLYKWCMQNVGGNDLRHPAYAPYMTKVGQIYFNIQPPPDMLTSIMNMFGGGK